MNNSYKAWQEKSFYREELEGVQCEKEIIDRFHQFLSFGTGGKLGACMNWVKTHTVRLVVEGLAREIKV